MTYAHITCAMFRNMLGTLDHLTERAEAAGLGDAILAARLVEDMFPLELQYRVALNQVLLALNQVGGARLPLHQAPYASLADVRARIAEVRAVVDAADPASWADPDATVDISLPGGLRFVMTAAQDMQDWILPNFWFHVTMVHALLRQAGVAIGKLDFLPHMQRHRVDAAP